MRLEGWEGGQLGKTIALTVLALILVAPIVLIVVLALATTGCPWYLWAALAVLLNVLWLKTFFRFDIEWHDKNDETS